MSCSVFIIFLMADMLSPRSNYKKRRCNSASIQESSIALKNPNVFQTLHDTKQQFLLSKPFSYCTMLCFLWLSCSCPSCPTICHCFAKTFKAILGIQHVLMIACIQLVVMIIFSGRNIQSNPVSSEISGLRNFW